MSTENVTSCHVVSFHGLQCLQAVPAVTFQNWDVSSQLWPILAKPASDLRVLLPAYKGVRGTRGDCPPSRTWLGALSYSHGERAHHMRVENGGAAQKKHKENKELVST